MASLGSCMVCGTKTDKACAPCSRAGLKTMLFCSPEHQRLVWFAHKRVCGKGRANPFRMPRFTEKEVERFVELSTVDLPDEGRWVDGMSDECDPARTTEQKKAMFKEALIPLMEDGKDHPFSQDTHELLSRTRARAFTIDASIRIQDIERTGPKPAQLSSGDTFETTAGNLFHILPDILDNCSAPYWTELLHILVIFHALVARRDEAGQAHKTNLSDRTSTSVKRLFLSFELRPVSTNNSLLTCAEYLKPPSNTHMDRLENQAVVVKLDRLSSLPNELLDYIFDLAYTISTPSTGALSKRLLQWHIRGIYRRIAIPTQKKMVQLVDRINLKPELGNFVEVLHFEADWRDLKEIAEAGIIRRKKLQKFFSSLPNLEELDLGENGSEQLGVLQKLLENLHFIYPENLPALVKLQIPGYFPFEIFTSFPRLQSLSLSDYDEEPLPLSHDNLQLLDDLAHLSIEGSSSDHVAFASLCSLAPNLSHLHLDCRIPPFYSELLLHLPSSLEKLELLFSDSDCWEEDGLVEPCDSDLGRFEQLRHLSLGNTLFSPELPSYISRLDSLGVLKLGKGKLSIDRFLPLLSGPTRLPQLQRIRLDLTEGGIGHRLEVDEDGSVANFREQACESLVGEDWVVPGFDVEGTDFTYERAEELVRVAEGEGIRVEGSILKSLKVYGSYLLEVANYAVYRCHRYKDFGYIEALQVDSSQLSRRLPPLDFSSLDPWKLKLVKTEHPEEKWFALSLENQ
ncbi:hypothetical protein JCM3765_000945 [Sporobolomyces pararoseus]